MGKLNDYRMINRKGKDAKKNKWLKRREFQRAECKMLTLFFFGGLMNKFHTKWKRSDYANMAAHKNAMQSRKASKLRKSGTVLNPNEYTPEEIAKYEAERALLEQEQKTGTLLFTTNLLKITAETITSKVNEQKKSVLVKELAKNANATTTAVKAKSHSPMAKMKT